MGPKVSADEGSVALGGSNSGYIVNANQSTLNLAPAPVALPSRLARVIAYFSQQSLSEYGYGARRELPPEVTAKLDYNNFPLGHRLLTDYKQHSNTLERTYHGVEQQNNDARFLVRRRAGYAYEQQLNEACAAAGAKVPPAAFARANAVQLIEKVVAQLLADYLAANALIVDHELAHLAICLIVLDAVVECEVLERPLNASAS